MSTKPSETPKWVIYASAFASIATIIGVIIAYFSYVHPASSSSGSGIAITNNVNNSNANTSSGGNPAPAIVPATPTPGPIWTVIMNRTYNNLTYNNGTTTYTVNDTNGHHFLIVDASFENMSNIPQSLSGSLFDLQDEYSQHYSEDQASNPQNSFAVDPGQSLETTTAFVVPNSSCKFTLSFIAGSAVERQWTIQSSLCSQS